MRTRVFLLACLVAILSGCGSGTLVAPTAATVVGSVPTTSAVKGDAAAGKTIFASSGCGGCHTFKAAGTAGKVGPDLDNLATDAQKAGQGPVDQYTMTSIKNPSAYVVPGFNDGVMPSFGSQLSDKQIADLAEFLTKQS